jgi:glycosyltransferase involved in cell wall biosynthesis
MLPLLTVFIPAFNGASYIEDAIESVISSSTADLEVVVVDDGSTDDTVQRVEQFRHPAIRLFRQSMNLGVAATRARSTPLFRGKYLALLDCDDIALPDRFDRQLERLESSGGPDIVGGYMQLFGERSGVVCPPTSHVLIRTVLLFFCPIANPTVCMRMAPFRDGRLRYSAAARVVEDYDLWFQAARHGLRFENIDRIVTRYRCHPESTSRKLAQEAARRSALVQRQVTDLYFPRLDISERDALTAAVSGEAWRNAQQLEAGVGALSHAAELAPLVPEIDSSVMVHMLTEVLIAHTSTALRNRVVDNDFLEQITETDDRFERWRARDGGDLDRRIMDLVNSVQRESP